MVCHHCQINFPYANIPMREYKFGHFICDDCGFRVINGYTNTAAQAASIPLAGWPNIFEATDRAQVHAKQQALKQQFHKDLYNHGRSQEVRKLTYELTHNNTIVVIKFQSVPSKGWWKDNVQPALDFMKANVPATYRSYNGATYLWEVAIEYWPACKLSFEQVFKFQCTEGKINVVNSDPLKNMHVDASVKENFYHKPEVITNKEDATSIAKKLSAYLGVEIKTQELSELKKLYRSRARALHPDLNPDPKAAQEMSELNRLWTLYTAGGVN